MADGLNNKNCLLQGGVFFMSGNRNVSPTNKLEAVKEYLSGNGSLNSLAKKYGVSYKSFCKWVNKYKAFGEDAFVRTGHNQTYSKEFKEKVVLYYLSGEASYEELSIKYKISSFSTIHQWVLKYNGHEELKVSRTGGNPIMTNGRKTTYDERIEIVKYCIEHQNNYTETALKYEVSYQQVYTWCRKYETNGVEALQDKRGRKKIENEMSELEKLRAENKLLRAENRRKDLENAFLKKLEEIERRRY